MPQLRGTGGRVCVIGAGIAGLVTAKVLRDDGFEVTVFERSPAIGGVWASSRTYPGLRANNPRETYAFADFPYPATADDFPTAEQVRAYLDAYVEHFGLRPLLRLGTEVRTVSRLRASLAKTIRAQPFGYIDPAGDARLREQVSDRLRGTRGIVRSAQQIVITSGAQQAVDICARLLVGQGDGVVVEEPGYSAARAVFAAAGGTLIPVPVDRHGLDPAALPGERCPVRVVHVTPSHQFPTGAVMSASRRHALLAWAKQRGACIIEDDYDGELRYIGRPIKALAALDGADQVIYCSTLSKSLFPALRLGYLALPEWLTADAIAAKWLSDLGGSALIQQTVCDLMATGEYDRHISRMRRRYSARRETLTRELRLHLRSEIEIEGDGAGLHLVVWMPNLTHAQVEALAAACERRGIGVYSIARHGLRPLERPGVMLGYGLLDESQIREGIRGLAAAFWEVSRPAPSRKPRSSARHRARR
jgi:GntR family transcriptional regulator/MocR family aminotransferase